MNTKSISWLFHNGDYFNLPELAARLQSKPNIGDSFDHGKEFRRKSQNEHGIHCSQKFTDFDHLASNYEDLKEITIDFSNIDDVKLYFAECCFAWALYHAYNIKANGRYAGELSDLKSRIKVCVRHFIDNGLKSKGYYSKFYPHPDYNSSWQFHQKTSKHYRNILKELVVFSFYIFLGTVIDRLYWDTDRIIIGKYLGASVIGIYSISNMIIQLYMSVSTAVSEVLLTKINQMVAKESNKEISNLFIKIGRLQYMLIGLICTGFIRRLCTAIFRLHASWFSAPSVQN